jgi:hypothetical protein
VWEDYALACGAGGWNLSPSDVVLLFNALVKGQLLMPDLQAELFNTSSPNFPGLGWDNTVGNCLASGGPNSYTGPNTYAWCKNGGEGKAPGDAIETYVGLFKCNAVTVVVFVNSPLPVIMNMPQLSNISNLIADAYQSTGTGGTQISGGNPQPCPTTNVGG